MKEIFGTISESTLTTNLNELAHSLKREFTMAARKVAVYGSGHPVAEKALGKPFLFFDRVFRFKQYINFNIQKGNLHILNIRLKESVFSQEIIRLMQTQDVNALLFKRGMTVTQFGHFIDRFVKRVDLSVPGNTLSSYLAENGIDTIEADSERAYQVFELNKQYRGDVDGDFSVKSFAFQELGNDLSILARFDQMEKKTDEDYSPGFNRNILEYLLPEKVALIPVSRFHDRFVDLTNEVANTEDEKKRQSLVDEYRGIIKLADYHADRDKILQDIDDLIEGISGLYEHTDHPGIAVADIMTEVSSQIEALLGESLSKGVESCDADSFYSTYLRLLKTGQQKKAIDVLFHLIDRLEASDPNTRQRALELLVTCVERTDMLADNAVLEETVNRVISRLDERKETFEYSELIWRFLEKAMQSRKFDLMARLAKTMAKRRRVSDTVTIYDSMAVKQAFNQINQPEVINVLIDKMLEADFEEAGDLRDVLIAVGSEEVAMALSNIISHPMRQVRQQSLKVLAELGKASLKVFSRIMNNDTRFEREPGRHELPENKWYIIRNSIFVLGLLKDTEGVAALRLRISDDDIRVRREIVRALEKIGGEEACDMLILMADDHDREIQESAVIAAGLVGAPDAVPLFVDVADRHPSLAVRVVLAIGNLGGDEARNYLVGLLGDDQILSAMAGGRVSTEDLKLAVIKSLGHIGDDKSIKRIRDFRENLSTTKKILFRGSAVNKAIEEILDRN